MELRSHLIYYTEEEFKALINAIDDAGTEEDRGKLVEHFNKVVPHPSGSDLLFYPEKDANDSPDGIVQTIKDYCLKQGLPGFRSN